MHLTLTRCDKNEGTRINKKKMKRKKRNEKPSTRNEETHTNTHNIGIMVH